MKNIQFLELAVELSDNYVVNIWDPEVVFCFGFRIEEDVQGKRKEVFWTFCLAVDVDSIGKGNQKEIFALVKMFFDFIHKNTFFMFFLFPMKNLVENAISKRVVFDNNRYSLKELFESFLVLSLQGDLLLDEKMEEIIFDEQKLCNGKVIFVHSCQDNVHNWNIFNLEIEDESD